MTVKQFFDMAEHIKIDVTIQNAGNYQEFKKYRHKDLDKAVEDHGSDKIFSFSIFVDGIILYTEWQK